MAEVIWAEPAFNDLDAIADYIALDNPEAARQLVQKIFEHVEPPCRIFYREDSGRVLILHVMRSSAYSGPNFLPIESKVRPGSN